MVLVGLVVVDREVAGYFAVGDGLFLGLFGN
jgi:hypothetical protein